MRKLFTLLLAVAASVGTMFAWDYEHVQIGDLYYNLDATNHTAEVTNMGSSDNYLGLTSVNIPSSVEYYSMTYSVTSIGYYAFAYCSGLTSIEIPNSVTYIESYVFYGCTGLTSIEIPNNVISIGEKAFASCNNLEDVTIGTGVILLGVSVFSNSANIKRVQWNAINYRQTKPNHDDNCFPFYASRNSITSFIFGDDVEYIPEYLFKDFSAIHSLVIPASVTEIAQYAFANNSLAEIICLAETPPTLGNDAFYGSNAQIYVPCGTLDAYKTAWSGYASQIKLPYKIVTHAENGNVDIVSLGNYTTCDTELYYKLTAVPDYGYHFVQWSDGNTDNPRAIVLTQDTTFTAEFAYDRVGTCGKDLALVWSYDPTNKVLTIGNAGEFTENMQFGAEAPSEMEELVIGNNVTAIGENAFAGISTLKKVTIGESVKTIHNNAFYNCVNLETIFNYRPTPTNAYSTAFDGVDKFACSLYVLPSSIDMYKAAAVWRDFYHTYAIGAVETTVTTNDVTVEPQDNAATVTWPTSNNAATYTIQITKDGVVFCTLIFNANGQLTGIAFAPGKNGNRHAPAAKMTANGMQFTVTGLNSGTNYHLTLKAKDSGNQEIASYAAEFTTTGTATAIDDTPFPSGEGRGEATKLLRNGQIYIIRGDKTYTLTGVELK